MGGIATAEEGAGGLGGAKRLEYAILQGEELLLFGRLFFRVLGDGNVDDAAGGDVRGQEDGGKLDLRKD